MAEAKQLVASALIPDLQGRIFLQRRAMTRKMFPGCWDLVGGHVEADEDTISALKREVDEETGWKLRSIIHELIPKPWRSGSTEYLERQFIVEVHGDLASPVLESSKVMEWMWVDRENTEKLKEMREPGDQLIYDSVVEALEYLERIAALKKSLRSKRRRSGSRVGSISEDDKYGHGSA